MMVVGGGSGGGGGGWRKKSGVWRPPGVRSPHARVGGVAKRTQMQCSRVQGAESYSDGGIAQAGALRNSQLHLATASPQGASARRA